MRAEGQVKVGQPHGSKSRAQSHLSEVQVTATLKKSQETRQECTGSWMEKQLPAVQISLERTSNTKDIGEARKVVSKRESTASKSSTNIIRHPGCATMHTQLSTHAGGTPREGDVPTGPLGTDPSRHTLALQPSPPTLGVSLRVHPGLPP